MSQSRTLDVGMDVHQDSIAVAYVAQAHGAEVVYLGTIGTRHGDIDQLIRTMPIQGQTAHLCLRSGTLWVLALSLFDDKRLGLLGRRALTRSPNRPATVSKPIVGTPYNWPACMRSGDLTPVSVPSVEDEAIRDLSRAREDVIGTSRPPRFRLNAWLLRHDIRYTGRATWGPAHRRWLAARGRCRPPPSQSSSRTYVRAVHEPTERLHVSTQALHEPVKPWRLQPVVEALQALRGVPCTGAVTVVAEWGDLTRVDHPRPLMRDVGLTPAADSRGERRRQGSMTRRGTPMPDVHSSRGLGVPLSRARQSPPATAPGDSAPHRTGDQRKAPVRRCTRDRTLRARGKHAHQVVVAIARELSALHVGHGPRGSRDPLTCPQSSLSSARKASHRQGRGPGMVSPSTA